MPQAAQLEIAAPKHTRIFRKDLQALRALAVGAVVVYHLWPGALPGGFVGVDIFFVISGFLITGHIFKEIQTKTTFSFRSFYARRAKRILPPAYLTIVASIVGVLVFLPPNLWAETTRQGVGSIIYLQNLALATNSVDYLAQDGAATVFQHFWSLSVEEQFYIVLPLLLVGTAFVARKLGRSASVISLVVLGAGLVASFLHVQQLLGSDDPSAYFLLSTRLWELGAGSFLAIALGMTSRLRFSSAFRLALRKVLLVAGWSGLIISILITSTAHFPGSGALLPVLATLAVIWAHEPFTSGPLSQVPASTGVQYVGNISYSLYLTHWPLVILAPFALPQWPGWARAVLVLVLAVGLAALLHRYVEKPLQAVRVTNDNAWRILGITLGASVLAVVVALLPLAGSQYLQNKEAALEQKLVTQSFDVLGAQAIDGPRYLEFAAEPKVVIPAVSQARSILPSGSEGRCKSRMADFFTPVCEFGPDQNAEGPEAPDQLRVIALVGDSHIEHYLPAFEDLAQEHTLLVRTYFHASCPFSTGQRVTDAKRDGPCEAANQQTLEALSKATDLDMIVTSNRTDVPWSQDAPDPTTGFKEMWANIKAALPDVPIVVIEDNPFMLPKDGTTNCVAENLSDPDECSLPYDQAKVVDYQVPAAAQNPDVHLVRTKDWFCPDNICPAVIGNVLVYRDQQHLTTLYARSLAPKLWDEISPLLSSQ